MNDKEIKGIFQPFLPSYGYNSWTLKGEKDEELMHYLLDREKRERFVSKDFSKKESENIRIDTELSCVKETLNEIMLNVKSISDKLQIMSNPFGLEVWGQVNHKGMSTAMHKHENCFSFIYFVNAPQNCGNVNWYVNYDTKFESCQLDPSKKSLIFFPGWVPHFSMRNHSERPKIVLAGNLDFGENE